MDHNIWGKSVIDFKGKTTKKKPISLAGNLIQVPEDLAKLHKYIYLMTDLLFANSIPFLITLSRNMCFTAINNIANRKVETIIKALKYVYSYYTKRGFHITTLHTYVEFPPLQAMIYNHMPGGPRINITIANEHIPYIEHQIRLVQQRTRAVRHRLPLNKTLKLFTIYIVFTVFRMINYFTVNEILSAIISTNTIMSGNTLHYIQHLGINIGQ